MRDGRKARTWIKCKKCGHKVRDDIPCRFCRYKAEAGNMSLDDLIKEGCERTNKDGIRLENNLIIPSRSLKNVKSHFDECYVDKSIQGSLYLYGPPGCGKTTTAYILALEQVRIAHAEKNYAYPYAVKVIDLLNELRNDSFSNFNDQKDCTPVINKYQNMPWLMLDDFGINKMTDWTFQELYRIIDYRYEWELPTIITSNFDLDQLEERLGDSRITSRIKAEYDQILFEMVE